MELGSGAWVQVWGCNGYPHQWWTVRPYNGAYQIVTASGSRCVDAVRGDAQQVVVNPCNGSSTQSWRVDSFSDSVRFRSVAYNKCLDIYDYGRSNVVNLWSCGTQLNQRWRYRQTA